VAQSNLPASDGAGKVFANDESVGDIAVIDVKTLN